MSETNYLQGVGPVDECAVHGREHMLRSRPRAPMYIDGQPHGEPVETWYCLVCMHENTERERVRADKAEARIKELEEVINKKVPEALRELTPEEIEAYPALTDKEIQAALDRGREEARLYLSNSANNVPPGLRFK